MGLLEAPEVVRLRRILWIGVAASLALLPALASGHPPGADPHNSCLQPRDEAGPASPPVLVQQTLSYLAPLGTSPLPCGPAATAEFGSHAQQCPPPPWTGPVAGAYCGPMVGAGLTATCTWNLNVMTVPTRLVIGFDGLPAGPNGFVSLVADGERPVFGPYGPGSWRVINPYGVPARVMAFPTNVAMPPDPAAGVLAPGDSNWVTCVTP